MTPPRDRTFIYRVVGDFMVFVHSEKPPSEAEWDHIVEVFRGVNLLRTRVLVLTHGGAPNARQRAQVNDVLRIGQARIAVLTGSALTRAAATAMHWFVPTLRAFALDDLDAALGHLEASDAERKLLTTTLRELDSELRRAAGMARPPDELTR